MTLAASDDALVGGGDTWLESDATRRKLMTPGRSDAAPAGSIESYFTL
jgi:hypothetical protein